jgi:fructose-1,6-bisphosphatase/inositol monophosphatase family enzyme
MEHDLLRGWPDPLPSDKSSGWHSWDIAACLAIAEASGIVLRAVDGIAIRLDDLDAHYRVPWICARNSERWNLVRAAVTT